MGNRIIVIAFIGLISALLLTSAYSQEDMVAVDNGVFENARRSPSIFVHDAHNEKAGIDECYECHHVYADGELVEDESSEDQACSDCHGFESEGSRNADRSADIVAPTKLNQSPNNGRCHSSACPPGVHSGFQGFRGTP